MCLLWLIKSGSISLAAPHTKIFWTNKFTRSFYPEEPESFIHTHTHTPPHKFSQYKFIVKGLNNVEVSKLIYRVLYPTPFSPRGNWLTFYLRCDLSLLIFLKHIVLTLFLPLKYLLKNNYRKHS